MEQDTYSSCSVEFRDRKMAIIRILVTLISVQLIGGEKILAVFPSDIKSHFTLGKVVLTELANRGHEVTCKFNHNKLNLS